MILKPSIKQIEVGLVLIIIQFYARAAPRENFTDFLYFSFNFLLICMQVSAPEISGAALRVALRATIRSGAPTALRPLGAPLRSAALQCSANFCFLKFADLSYVFQSSNG